MGKQISADWDDPDKDLYEENPNAEFMIDMVPVDLTGNENPKGNKHKRMIKKRLEMQLDKIKRKQDNYNFDQDDYWD